MLGFMQSFTWESHDGEMTAALFQPSDNRPRSASEAPGRFSPVILVGPILVGFGLAGLQSCRPQFILSGRASVEPLRSSSSRLANQRNWQLQIGDPSPKTFPSAEQSSGCVVMNEEKVELSPVGLPKPLYEGPVLPGLPALRFPAPAADVSEPPEFPRCRPRPPPVPGVPGRASFQLLPGLPRMSLPASSSPASLLPTSPLPALSLPASSSPASSLVGL